MDLQQFYWGDYTIPRYTDAMLYLADAQVGRGGGCPAPQPHKKSLPHQPRQAEGRVRHLGVTNFDVPRMQRSVHPPTHTQHGSFATGVSI